MYEKERAAAEKIAHEAGAVIAKAFNSSSTRNIKSKDDNHADLVTETGKYNNITN